jgi:hypothetical protein
VKEEAKKLSPEPMVAAPVIEKKA